MNNNIEGLMKQSELTKYLNISRRTLFTLRLEGLPVRRVGKSIRFAKCEVDEWISGNKIDVQISNSNEWTEPNRTDLGRSALNIYGELYKNTAVCGYGKSKYLFIKKTLINKYENENDIIIICDKDLEYLNVVKKLNGKIVDLNDNNDCVESIISQRLIHISLDDVSKDQEHIFLRNILKITSQFTTKVTLILQEDSLKNLLRNEPLVSKVNIIATLNRIDNFKEVNMFDIIINFDTMDNYTITQKRKLYLDDKEIEILSTCI